MKGGLCDLVSPPCNMMSAKYAEMTINKQLQVFALFYLSLGFVQSLARVKMTQILFNTC